MNTQKVIEIVKQAGDMFASRDFDVEYKTSVYDKVTSMDIKIEKFLKQELMDLLDGSGFLGEESEDVALDSEYVWIVDPIDGTSNFVRDFRCSCVSVALMQNDEVILGVVYNPYADELFMAEQGRGATLNDDKIFVSNTVFERSILLTSPHPYYKGKSQNIFGFMADIYNHIDDFRRSGSGAIDLCNLACGRGDMAYKLILSPWDFAAAVLIVREAGGIVGTLEPNVFTYRNNIPIVAANNKENYDRLKGYVTKYFK